MDTIERIPLGNQVGREFGEERGSVFHPDRFLRVVEAPSLHLHRGATEPKDWVILLPGGGYGGVCIDKEGHEVARLLNAWGLGAAVLYYRLPDPNVYQEPPRPMADVWAAMETMRKLCPAGRLGLMGFSAGGHLALASALDHPSRKADFLILGYPVVSAQPPFTHAGSFRNLLGPDPSKEQLLRFSMETRVDGSTPPCFVVHSEDDKGVPIRNSEVLGEAFAKAGRPFTLSRQTWGGHGFGLPHGPKNAVPDWPVDLHHWLKGQKLIP